MKKLLLILFLCIALAYISSCKKDFFVTGTGKLAFTTDTLTFDTVFTTRGSATRYFKIINPQNKGIAIKEVYLAGGKNSTFRINLNAASGTEFQDIIIPPKDSLYLFAEVTVDPTNADNPFIILDSIIFQTEEARQKVTLAAWGQNAYFHNGETICNQTWINDKPHVILNSMLVDTGCTLTVQEGVQVYSHAGSSIFISGTLKVNGTLENPVVFQGDRLESFFEDLPGQWGAVSQGVPLGGLHFTTTSTNNQINYAEIKDGIVGIRVDSLASNFAPKLEIKNSIIKNMSKTGIEAYTATIYAENCLIHSIGKHNLALLAGGFYEFIHCTIANYSGTTINHKDPILKLGNYYVINEIAYIAPISATFTNTIIHGSEENEFVTDFLPGTDTLYYFDHTLIKTTRPTTNPAHYEAILNTDPQFIQKGEDFHLEPTSPAINAGISTPVTVDIEANPRTPPPDLGAYEN